MKAISVRQPWAWLIVHGFKDIENRTWRTTWRGPILIHASKKADLDCDKIRQACADLGITIPGSLPTGGIVGIVTITDCVTDCASDWFSGPVGWVLAEARPLPFQPARGLPGLFDVDYNVKEQGRHNDKRYGFQPPGRLQSSMHRYG